MMRYSNIESRLCKYCFNQAETGSYRERNGQVSRELVCFRCEGLTNKALEAIDKRKPNINIVPTESICEMCGSIKYTSECDCEDDLPF